MSSQVQPRDTSPEPIRGPLWAIGDAVWAPNDQPRIVTAVQWELTKVTFSSTSGHEYHWWLWIVDTVHPDDPTRKGRGWDTQYRPRPVNG